MPIKYEPGRLDDLIKRFDRALKRNIEKAPHAFTDDVKANRKSAVARFRDRLMTSGFRDVTLRGSLPWQDVAKGLGLPATQRSLDAYLRGK